MLPGKKYTPEDILRILRRRFWLLLVPFAIVAAATAAASRRAPGLVPLGHADSGGAAARARELRESRR